MRRQLRIHRRPPRLPFGDGRLRAQIRLIAQDHKQPVSVKTGLPRPGIHPRQDHRAQPCRRGPHSSPPHQTPGAMRKYQPRQRHHKGRRRRDAGHARRPACQVALRAGEHQAQLVAVNEDQHPGRGQTRQQRR